MSARPFRYPVWVRGDLDGFFGLMVDNLVQVLLIIDLCKYVAGLPDFLIYERILPGVAISLIIGNVFYGVQAHRVARKSRNANTTALPYGINTPSVIAYALFIMGPVYRSTGDGHLAWQAGLLACLVSGVIEFLGAFFAEKLRRITPRAALLGVLAAIGITFIAGDFAFRIYTRPLVGIVPLALLLLAYFARYRFPLGLPGGFLAILLGSLIAWGATLTGVDWFGGVAMSGEALRQSLSSENVRWIAPVFVGGELWDLLTTDRGLLISYLTVSIPMGYINVLGSLQNIESAEAGGDRYATGPSLAVNGVGTIAAGLFGSCFPTTIYIGHPGWKALGAKAGYSIVNGVFFTLVFLLGLGPFLRALIPIEAGAAIVMYIGIIITAQAFQATPKAHAPAVAIALFPAMAALFVVKAPLLLADLGAQTTLAEVLTDPGRLTQIPELPGLIALTGANSGWILVTLILTAIGAALIDLRYRAATLWAASAMVLTLIGAMHSYRLQGNVIREYFIWQRADAVHLNAAPPADAAIATTTRRAATPTIANRALPIAAGYALATVIFGLAATRRRNGPPDPAPEVSAPAPPPEPEQPDATAATPADDPDEASTGEQGRSRRDRPWI